MRSVAPFALPLAAVFASLPLSACDGSASECEEGDTCDSGGDSGDTGLPDTGDTHDTDTGDTDTGTPDTGDTSDPDDTGPDDSGGGGGPLPAYSGPSRVAVLAADFALGGADVATLSLYDQSTQALTVVPDLAVRADSLISCAGAFIWVLESNLSESTPDRAYAVDGSTGELVATIELGNYYTPSTVYAQGEAYLFGGLGSASLQVYAIDGTPVSSFDFSAYADADGLPEVVALAQGPEGMVAVLARRNITTGEYDSSQVVSFDGATGAVSKSASLTGKNAGRLVVQSPQGLLVVLDATRTGDTVNEDGGVESFDVGAFTSGGIFIDFTGVSRVATALGANDGSIATAVRDDAGSITVNRYGPDGSLMGSFAAFTVTDGLAIIDGGFASGEGGGATSSLAIRSVDGTQTGGATIGHDIRNVSACAAPPPPPDDSGAPDSGQPPE